MINEKRDPYNWSVLYRDGRLLREYDHPDGLSFANVDASQVKELKLDSWDIGRKAHDVEMPEGAQAVFFRKRIKRVNPLTQEKTNNTAHCIGWKRGEEGVYLFVLEDDSTLLSTDPLAVLK